ncbi:MULTISPECIES: hypothetical protein [unclassified Streptomyces]|uniref:hypothetical protein n=1 Tax=unclassified Streptomyces TaxID=2593676 RepID=UPI0033B99830
MNNADPHVTFLSSAVVRAATEAAALHRRCRGERFTSITFGRTLDGKSWNLNTGMLTEPARRIPSAPGTQAWQGGGGLIASVAEPPTPDLPESIAQQARERIEAADRLAKLLKDVSVHVGFGGLSIPLRPER